MSNKLKKRSKDYEAIKNELRGKIEKEGGVNVTPDMVKEYTEESEGDHLTCTYDEFFEILSELSNDGYSLFKITKLCEGKETRGLMVCNKDIVVAFTKDPKEE